MKRYAVHVSFSRKPANQRRALEGPGAVRAAVTLAKSVPIELLVGVDRGLRLALRLVQRRPRSLLARENAVDRVEVGLDELLTARGRGQLEAVLRSVHEDLDCCVELRMAERLVDVLVRLLVGDRVRRVDARERRAGSLASVEALLRGGHPGRLRGDSLHVLARCIRVLRALR